MDDLYNMPLDQLLQQSGIIILVCMAAALAAGIAVMVVAARQIREIDIPEDADFFETLQAIPITVPIALDLLDLGLGILAAPISWVILEMLGLGALKMITTIEAILPGPTNLSPTMTAAWVIARMMKKERNTPFRQAMRDQQMLTRGQYPQVTRGGRSRAEQIRRMALPPGARSGMAGGRALSDGDVLGDVPGGIRSSRRRTAAGDDFVEGEFDDLDVPGRIGRPAAAGIMTPIMTGIAFRTKTRIGAK
jgi:hypothetical protein